MPLKPIAPFTFHLITSTNAELQFGTESTSCSFFPSFYGLAPSSKTKITIHFDSLMPMTSCTTTTVLKGRCSTIIYGVLQKRRFLKHSSTGFLTACIDLSRGSKDRQDKPHNSSSLPSPFVSDPIECIQLITL